MLQCVPPESWFSSHCEKRSSELAPARADVSTVRRYSMRTIVRTPSAALLERVLDWLQVEGVIQLDLEALGAGLHVILDVLDRADRDVGGPLDLGGIAADLRAPRVDDLILVADDVRRAARIRHLGVFGGQPQRALLTAAADQNGYVAHGRRVPLFQPILDSRQRVAQLGQPLSGRTPGQAVRAMVAFRVAGPKAQDQPTRTQVIDRSSHVRQQVRIAVADRTHDRADLRPPRIARHRRQQRPALEVGSVKIAREGVEMIPDGDAVHSERVGAFPGRTHGIDRGVLRPDVDADFVRAPHVLAACFARFAGTVRAAGLGVSPGVSHMRNPPRKALALSPRRALGGSSFSNLALPPPRMT